MTTTRLLMLMLLTITVTSLPIATSTAYASGFDAAEDLAYYLWQYYGW